MSDNNHLDDLPQRSRTHEIEDQAITAFENAIAQENVFVIQSTDRKDYGSDYQLEVIKISDGSSMTNVRVCVQLKGSTTVLNADDSVSVQISRTNLNYLLTQPNSIYVCYHIPSKQLLTRSTEDIYCQYEAEGSTWRAQESVTVKFKDTFTSTFQTQLNKRAMASAESSRNNRLLWAQASPDEIPKIANSVTPIVHLPANPERAYEVLTQLYNNGGDAIISASFAQFEAVLAHLPEAMLSAYMSEINQGINGYPFNEERLRRAIFLIEEMKSKKTHEAGTLTYCIANAHLALGEHERAKDFYLQAIKELPCPEASHVIAMCYKNLGSTYKELACFTEERASYEKALELAPDLSEAVFALAVCLCQDGEYQNALEYLDSIDWQFDSVLRSASVQGWRIPIFFNLGNPSGAFREINTLLAQKDSVDWILPWCAKYTRQFGKESIESIRKSLLFWKRYLLKFPEDIQGRHECLICLWRLHEENIPVEMNFEEFTQEALDLVDIGHPDPSFLWDRIGHWAQTDGQWDLAEGAYRKACEVEPDMYGYCLGTALNHLGRYKEALPLLIAQAEKHMPDELSWFGTAIAHEGIGNIKDAIEAYKRALAINPNYDLAWFNLGGVYWNVGEIDLACATWKEAIRLFPDHELVEKSQYLMDNIAIL